MHNIIIVQLDDWQIWYVDGVVHYSHHSMEDIAALELGRKLKDFTYSWVYPENFMNHEREADLFHMIYEGDKLTSLLDKLTPEEFAAFTTEIEKNLQ